MHVFDNMHCSEWDYSQDKVWVNVWKMWGIFFVYWIETLTQILYAPGCYFVQYLDDLFYYVASGARNKIYFYIWRK